MVKKKIETDAPYQREFKQLSDALYLLADLYVIHESKINDIDSFMAEIYKKENKLWKKENLSKDDDLDDIGDAPIFELFERVEKKDIFIIDYVSAIQECLFNNSFSTSNNQSPVERILENRKQSQRLKNTLKEYYPNKTKKS